MKEVLRYIWDNKSGLKRPRGVHAGQVYIGVYEDLFKRIYVRTNFGNYSVFDGFISEKDYLLNEFNCVIGDLVIVDDKEYILLGIASSSTIQSKEVCVKLKDLNGVIYHKQTDNMTTLKDKRMNIINEILI